MSAAVSSAYLQLLSVGVVWVSLHCTGMCGPLVVGLGLGRTDRVASPTAQLLAYQLGKGSVYAGLGALAGRLGAVVGAALERVGPALAGILGLALVAMTIARNVLRARPPGSWASTLTGPLRLLQKSKLSPLQRGFLLGGLMAGLPCMLVIWVLALSASTQSALHGALVMLLLVAMNTFPLVLATRLPGQISRRLPRVSALGPWLGLLSGAWLLLVSAAAAGFIRHASLDFGLGGRGYVLMFW